MENADNYKFIVIKVLIVSILCISIVFATVGTENDSSMKVTFLTSPGLTTNTSKFKFSGTHEQYVGNYSVGDVLMQTGILYIPTNVSTSSNTAPSVANITILPDDGGAEGVQVQPNENTIKTITIGFNVSDSDGIADLTGTINLTNTSGNLPYIYVNSSCVNTSCAGTVCVFTCSWGMNYSDSFGFWNVNVTASDGTAGGNLNETFYYNKLTALQFENNVQYGEDVPGGTNTSDQSNVLNTGNDIFKINMSGDDLTGGNYSEVINASSFKWDTDSDPSDGTMLTTTNISVSNNLVAGDTQPLWFYVAIPSGKRPDSYTGQYVFYGYSQT